MSSTMRANGRRAWQIGQRIIRQDSGERGTVVENDGSIKVKWDGGRTSSFRHGQAANVQLETTRANYQFWPAARPGMRVRQPALCQLKRLRNLAEARWTIRIKIRRRARS